MEVLLRVQQIQKLFCPNPEQDETFSVKNQPEFWNTALTQRHHFRRISSSGEHFVNNAGSRKNFIKLCVILSTGSCSHRKTLLRA